MGNSCYHGKNFYYKILFYAAALHLAIKCLSFCNFMHVNYGPELLVKKCIVYRWNGVSGGSLRNVESARISVPSTLKFDESRKCYTYRTQLEETESYWKGWYEGLSEKFLSCPVPKLLLLAGTDRLDRPLTIGQMQGKFQMVPVRHTGHAIQEDAPEEFASLVLNFISRNRIGPHGVEIPGLLRRPQT
ncbi:hypothetical protein HPP92_005619 [Vanilla planifolia]|uniref:protein phosphatase methylesterase-1 n=1 Tax=Vanilla planifolia TaxID=51239 RepID=A0A835VDC3_VANPL|nr:hypothetical protein HPP92_005619 [Vanilla planifolia]